MINCAAYYNIFVVNQIYVSTDSNYHGGIDGYSLTNKIILKRKEKPGASLIHSAIISAYGDLLRANRDETRTCPGQVDIALAL